MWLEARVPLIVGPRNAGKSTVLEPLDAVFQSRVMHKPKLGASCPLAKLVTGNVRFLFFDDYRPVEYAALPKDNPTVAPTTFLAMFCGQPFDVQLPQNHHDGHPELVWRRGAAMTAKDEGLWDPMGLVTREEIRHMQARVEQFTATAVLLESAFRTVPNFKESFARWLLVDSVSYAALERPAAEPGSQVRRLLPALSLPDEHQSEEDL